MIGADEVASCINATTTQAFNVKMKKDSSDEESDGDDTDPDYGGNERVSVLSDEEDEEGEQTAKGNIATPVTTEGIDTQATQTLNPGKAIGDDTAETQEDKDSDDDDKKPTGPRDGSVWQSGRKNQQKCIRPCVHQSSAMDHQGAPLSKIFFPTTVTCLDGSVA